MTKQTVIELLKKEFSLSLKPVADYHGILYIGYGSILLDANGRAFCTHHNKRYNNKIAGFIGDDSRFFVTPDESYRPTQSVKPEITKTVEECNALLESDLTALYSQVPYTDFWNEKQTDALVLLAYLQGIATVNFDAFKSNKEESKCNKLLWFAHHGTRNAPCQRIRRTAFDWFCE